MELQATRSSINMTFVSEAYPKGKKYIFNNAVADLSADQLQLLMTAMDKLVDGKNALTEVHRVEELGEEEDE